MVLQFILKNQHREIILNDEVEFTVVQEQGLPYNSSRLHAIRIRHLPPNSVEFETLVANNIEGNFIYLLITIIIF